MSVLERMCRLVLTWPFLEDLDIAMAKTDKLGVIEMNEQEKIPLVFKSYSQYLSCWEPLLIQEIKANLISNFSAKVKSKLNLGFIELYRKIDESTDLLALKTLECSFNNNNNNAIPAYYEK
jgi:hypothetical protein